MRMLITGASGHLGGATAVRAAAAGWTVTGTYFSNPVAGAEALKAAARRVVLAMGSRGALVAVAQRRLNEILPFAHLAVEDQPSPLAETIPTGVQQVNAPQAWAAGTVIIPKRIVWAFTTSGSRSR